MATVGVIVNPLAGKDIRRLVAHASPTSDAAKIGVVRRAVVGAVEGGATRILLAPDPHRLGERAVDGLVSAGVRVEVLDEAVTGARRDSVAAAARLWKEQAGAVVVLGGDGTNRDVTRGWPEAPLVAIATGTNNVFPQQLEATSAGLAAGLVACGQLDLAEVSTQAKRIAVELDGGHEQDLALVEVGLLTGRFLGARAVWDPGRIRAVVACIAEPATTGLSSIAARLAPVARHEPGGVLVRVGAGPHSLRVPLAPGVFGDLHDVEVRPLAEGQAVELDGPGLLAFDGEHDRHLADGSTARLTIRRDGPFVIDVAATLHRAVDRGLFELTAEG